MAKKNKFYAVRKGATPGIYENWPEAEAQVKGYPGAQFKGFTGESEARDWLAADTVPRQRKSTSQQKRQTPVQRQTDDADMVIYTDGGALNNPGPGGYGVVLVSGDTREELYGGYRLTTNNRMELMACIVALREVQGFTKKIVLYSDSSYVVNGITKGWVKNWQRNGWRKADKQPVMNRELWEELITLVNGLDIRFCWVKGHAGNPLNERCDELAVRSARADNLGVDTVYESSRVGADENM